MNLERAQRIYRAGKNVCFSPIKILNDTGMISLLTVAAEMRPVAFFPETEAAQVQAIRNLCTMFALPSERVNLCELLTHYDDEPAQIRNVPIKGPRNQLWVFSSEERRKETEYQFPTPSELGKLLGFPSCCVDAYPDADDDYNTATEDSFSRFSHIIHLACPDCIADPYSPSATMQTEIQDLLQAIDPAFASSVEVAKTRYCSMAQEAKVKR